MLLWFKVLSLHFDPVQCTLLGIDLAKYICIFEVKNTSINQTVMEYQVIIAQWLARRLATGEFRGSNPGKGENLLISD